MGCSRLCFDARWRVGWQRGFRQLVDRACLRPGAAVPAFAGNAQQLCIKGCAWTPLFGCLGPCPCLHQALGCWQVPRQPELPRPAVTCPALPGRLQLTCRLPEDHAQLLWPQPRQPC